MARHVLRLFALGWLLGCLAPVSPLTAAEPRRPAFWIDIYQGEPVTFAQVVDDLSTVRVVYLGESHRLARHHDVQTAVVNALAARDLPLVLGLEQLESHQQPILDRYNQGQIGFEQLAEQAGWADQWSNYQQYKPVLEAARSAGAPVIALNAKASIIRDVARGGGVEELPPERRRELPADMLLDDPPYERLLNLIMMVHMSAHAEMLRPMIEAQIARDEMMADVLCRFLESPQGEGRTAIVLCGSGHVNYGLGTVDRVRRRIEDVEDRIILMSESGDLELTPEEQAMAREVDITHADLRALGRPIADYLHIAPLADEE